MKLLLKMSIIYGFAVLLIIIPCESYPGDGKIIREIVHDLPSVFAPEIKGDGRVESYIVHIALCPNNRILITRQGDDYSLEFGNSTIVSLFFNKFGGRVRKIEINYATIEDEELYEMIPKIIEDCGHNLEELRFENAGDEDFWHALSNNINFENLKKFHFRGEIIRHDFNINSIFSHVESITLRGRFGNGNCLANVKNLRELALDTLSIQNEHLKRIFAKNKENIEKFAISIPEEPELWELVKKLKKLKTFEVHYPKSNFLIRNNINAVIHELSTVTDFVVTFDEMPELVGELAFSMPFLKRVTMCGYEADHQIIGFIGHFRLSKSVEVIRIEYDILDCIWDIKEYFQLESWTVSEGEQSGEYKKYLMFTFRGNATSRLPRANSLKFCRLM